MKRKIARLKDHYIICGIGETGLYVMEEFLKVGVPLVLVETDQERIEKCRQRGDILYIAGDCTDDEILIEAGIEQAQGIVAALPSDKDNLFITVTARQMNPHIRIVAKGAVKMKNKLLKAGANAVVCPQSIGGLRMASEMIRPSVVSFLDRMLRDTQKTIRIEEIFIKEGSSLVGKTIQDSNLKDKYNLLVLSTVHLGKVVYNPPADTALEPGLTLIVLGNNQEVRQAQELARG